jgi:hypothetical protein
MKAGKGRRCCGFVVRLCSLIVALMVIGWGLSTPATLPTSDIADPLPSVRSTRPTRLQENSQHEYPSMRGTQHLERRSPFSQRSFRYVIRSTAPRAHILRAALDSWATDVEVAFVAAESKKPLIVGNTTIRQIKASKPQGHDFGRKALKVLATMAREANTADFWVYVDDDTFVVTPNMEAVVGDAHSPDTPLYGGCAFVDRPVPLISSGGGIVFSKATLTALKPHVEDEDHACSWHNDAVFQMTGDQAISECMKALEIPAVHVHGFNQLSLLDITAVPRTVGSCGVDWRPKGYQCNPAVSRMITARMDPFEMKELHYLVMHMFSPHDLMPRPQWEVEPSNVTGSPPGSLLQTRKAPFSNSRFAYTILTTKEHHHRRLEPQLRTWGESANVAFVATDDVDQDAEEMGRLHNTKLLSLGAIGRHDLGRKTMRGVMEMCAQKADFYVFVDDDCFVFVPALEAYVSSRFRPSDPLYLGAALTHLKHHFISGGGGVVLSASTLNTICAKVNASTMPGASACHPENPAVWTKPGDTAIMDCVVEVGHAATHDDGFHPLRLSDMVDYSPAETSCDVWWIPKSQHCRPPTSITLTSHYTPPERFAWYHFVATRLIVQRSAAFSDPPVGAWRKRRPAPIPKTAA